ncbi:MAG: hypothetical protein ACSW8F_02175 [bacterium]
MDLCDFYEGQTAYICERGEKAKPVQVLSVEKSYVVVQDRDEKRFFVPYGKRELPETEMIDSHCFSIPAFLLSTPEKVREFEERYALLQWAFDATRFRMLTTYTNDQLREIKRILESNGPPRRHQWKRTFYS